MIIVVGSGIIGSWIAYTLAKAGEEVYVFEKSFHAGDGISGRNSGVLHSGIYYDDTSLKSKLCFRGYEIGIPFFEKYNIPHSICGKVITTGVSVSKNDETEKIETIESLYENGKRLGIPEIELRKDPAKHWKHILGSHALWIPKTGIVDVSSYLKVIWYLCEEAGVVFLKNKKVIRENGCVFAVDSNTNEKEELEATQFINAGGLYSDDLLDTSENREFEIRPNKGEYYRLKTQLPYETLVYPLPMKTSTALGVHYTFHFGGDAYVGPNSNWANSKEDYSIQTSRSEYFNSLKNIIDFFKEDDLSEGYVGLRPRLFYKGEAIKDFVIHKESNWIHLLGIESPGLTSAPAIAEKIFGMIV
ncbi:NAD(P)/FAD-dependent oxidoreductase [Leptospira limi]|uniref:FAD-dependent oxidoreductase n=1 Tax=Leptospira limi TaxID=2950023 RepID=A0ABT3LZ51_9LEPT|nr:FAD-dependent oxidoreductase [Leptospira limi]MCW7463004.1 FAD-dependent oxidoreductase [Leptospira limi]